MFLVLNIKHHNHETWKNSTVRMQQTNLWRDANWDSGTSQKQCLLDDHKIIASLTSSWHSQAESHQHFFLSMDEMQRLLPQRGKLPLLSLPVHDLCRVLPPIY